MAVLGRWNRRRPWLVTVACLVAGIIIGGCGSAAGPSASARPASASPPLASPSVRPLPAGGLDAGTYAIVELDEPVDIEVTVPDGWEGLGGVVVLKNNVGLSFWLVDNIYVDPCHERIGLLDPPPGPSVHDLAAALAAQPKRNGTDPVAVEVDGYPGEMVTITVPVDADLALCDGREFGSWSSDEHGARGHTTPGERDEIMIVDVDGVRLVIDAFTYPDSSAEDVAELRAVIDSIRLAPAGS